VHYLQDWEGQSPDEDSWITIDVLGTTDTGTYFLDRESTSWLPERVSYDGMTILAPTIRGVQAEIPTLRNPVRTSLLSPQTSLLHTAMLWLENPFTQTVGVTVTQPLVAALEVIDPGSGSVGDSAITWQSSLEPGASTVLTCSLQYQGNSGLQIELEGAYMEVTDLSTTEYITFTSNPTILTSKTPLVGSGNPIIELTVGEEASIPITITNLSDLQSVAGSVRLAVVAADGGVVYAAEVPVVMPPLGQQVLSLPLTLDVQPTWYVVRASVESNDGTYLIFSEFLRLWGPPVYLPLIMRNH
jgi:hypothetical protein